MPQSNFMSLNLQPWIKHINNMVNSLNISQKCCGEQGSAGEDGSSQVPSTMNPENSTLHSHHLG